MKFVLAVLPVVVSALRSTANNGADGTIAPAKDPKDMISDAGKASLGPDANMHAGVLDPNVGSAAKKFTDKESVKHPSAPTSRVVAIPPGESSSTDRESTPVLEPTEKFLQPVPGVVTTEGSDVRKTQSPSAAMEGTGGPQHAVFEDSTFQAEPAGPVVVPPIEEDRLSTASANSGSSSTSGSRRKSMMGNFKKISSVMTLLSSRASKEPEPTPSEIYAADVVPLEILTAGLDPVVQMSRLRPISGKFGEKIRQLKNQHSQHFSQRSLDAGEVTAVGVGIAPTNREATPAKFKVDDFVWYTTPQGHSVLGRVTAVDRQMSNEPRHYTVVLMDSTGETEDDKHHSLQGHDCFESDLSAMPEEQIFEQLTAEVVPLMQEIELIEQQAGDREVPTANLLDLESLASAAAMTEQELNRDEDIRWSDSVSGGAENPRGFAVGEKVVVTGFEDEHYHEDLTYNGEHAKIIGFGEKADKIVAVEVTFDNLIKQQRQNMEEFDPENGDELFILRPLTMKIDARNVKRHEEYGEGECPPRKEGTLHEIVVAGASSWWPDLSGFFSVCGGGCGGQGSDQQNYGSSNAPQEIPVGDNLQVGQQQDVELAAAAADLNEVAIGDGEAGIAV